MDEYQIYSLSKWSFTQNDSTFIWHSGKDNTTGTFQAKNPPASVGSARDAGLIPWSRKWQPAPVCLPGKFHGQRRLVGYSSWGHRVRYAWAHKRTCTHAEGQTRMMTARSEQEQQRMNIKQKEEISGGDGNVLHLDCGGSNMTTCLARITEL